MSGSAYIHGIPKDMLNTKFKTTMCKYWQDQKTCPKGDGCHFAHGPSELRKADDPLPDNTPIANPSKVPNLASFLPNDKSATNYKTTMCKYYEEGK